MAPTALHPDGALGEEWREPHVASEVRDAAADTRLREMLSHHFDFIWRSLRRFGLTDDRADDAAQQVFLVASRKLATIAVGSERSFLFGTAMRVASDVRRSAAYRREVAHPDPGIDLEGGVRPDELLEQSRARALLDATLDSMDIDLRSVFVLFELEEMTVREIASLLAIPVGTAASRLRRARDEFQSKLERLQRSSRPRKEGTSDGGGS